MTKKPTKIRSTGAAMAETAMRATEKGAWTTTTTVTATRLIGAAIAAQLWMMVGPPPAWSRPRFKFGDVAVNRAARREILRGDALLPGPDRSHLAVSPDHRLGYDTNHRHPDDPFRWQRLKEIIDAGRLDIQGVAPGQAFLVVEAASSTQRRLAARSLLEISPGAAGLTLVREPIARAGGYPYAASPDPRRDQIYFVTGRRPRIFRGSALSHELFGHLWLALRRLPFAHGDALGAAEEEQAQGEARADAPSAKGPVCSPRGRPAGGGVDRFIADWATAQDAPFSSPTQHVDPALRAQSEAGLRAAATARGGLARHRDGGWTVSPAWGLHWERLSNNYAIIRHTDPPAAQRLLERLETLYAGLNADQRYVLASFLRALLSAAPLGDVPGRTTRRTELAAELAARLPASTPTAESATLRRPPAPAPHPQRRPTRRSGVHPRLHAGRLPPHFVHPDVVGVGGARLRHPGPFAGGGEAGANHRDVTDPARVLPGGHHRMTLVGQIDGVGQWSLPP